MNKGYIIDLDGTLIDSMALWDNLGRYYLQELNITPSDDLNERLAVLSIDKAIDYLINEYSLKETKTAIYQQLNNLLAKLYQNEVTLKPGVVKFLTQCKNHHKKLCLLTANTKTITNIILNKYQLTNYFDLIITCDDTKLDKQIGNIYQEAADKLKLNKKDCIVIEDAYHAIKTAKDAGFTVWAVADHSNQTSWSKICKISDKHFKSMSEMEDSNEKSINNCRL